MTDVLPCRCSPAPDEEPACRPVTGLLERAEHHRIRQAVFVAEQRLFTPHDRDAYDDAASTVHVLGLVGGEPAGTVRLYPLDSTGTWKGDRLAVLPQHRHSGIGAPLVRFAVATAAARGGRCMLAQVQAVHTGFFVALGWTPLGEPGGHLGVPHRSMRIELR